MNIDMEMTTAGNGPSVLTPNQVKRQDRNRRICDEYCALMAENPGRSKMVVKDYLKEKYEIISDALYYEIIKDVKR